MVLVKDRIIERIFLIGTILVVLLAVYIGYRVVHMVNAKGQIKSDIKEVFKDYDIASKYKVKIRIHSKTNNSTKIVYNVEINNDKYDELDVDIQKEIIKYIKKISFKGNGKKYSINEVVINSNGNVYSYVNVFRKNDSVLSNKEDIIDSAKNTIKDKFNDLKDKVTN